MMTGGGEPSGMTTLPCKMIGYVSAAADGMRQKTAASGPTPKKNRMDFIPPPE
jgi:hypothetical protein